MAVSEEAVIDQVGEAGDDGAGVFQGDFGKTHQQEGEFPGECVTVDVLARARQAEQGVEEQPKLLHDPGFDLLIERL